MSIRFAACTAAIAAFAALAVPATAEPRLVMYEEEGCIWCERWNADIGPIYPKTDEGRIAPLERVDLGDIDKTGYTLVARPYFTPTFVLIDENREVGRIEGYPGEDFFWPLLAELIAKLPEEARVPAPAAADGS